MRFWVSFLPDEKRRLRPGGLHLFGLKYWHGALARDVGRTECLILMWVPQQSKAEFSSDVLR